METFTNISAYRFVELGQLKTLRDQILDSCKAWRLKGTILLSTEGINLFVAGRRVEIDLLLQLLRRVPGLENLDPKCSESREQPFQRMLVKIKREIIAFGVDGVEPARQTSPKLAPRELKRWLDEGRPVTLLDTRNDYEVKLGTFQRAMTLNIDHFREFPDAVQKLPDDLKQQPIVMFCTGGIRCEKAGPYMQMQGFEQIFQLDGGILKYFEECGSAHYDGECFVFDQRVGVDPSLHESETAQCFHCQTPLTLEDQRDERFVEGESCPYCFVSSEQQRSRVIAEHQAALSRAATPLPGSTPFENQRPLNVPLEYDGQTVLSFLTGILGHVPADQWKQRSAEGRLRKRLADASHADWKSAPTIPVSLDDTVRSGERYLHVERFSREPDVNPAIRILYEDQAIIVVHKPAPLPMHPCGRFNRNTLQYLLGLVYHPQSPRPAHRLDANTAGVVLFSRTKHFAKLVQTQFEHDGAATVKKRYLARVHGQPQAEQFSCDLPISDEAGPLGSREIDLHDGRPALTEFRVLRRFTDNTSLLEAIPRTGRTNQIRVHLWSLGHAICHDPTYLADGRRGECQTIDTASPAMCLLAQKIELLHPVTRKPVCFETELEPWCGKDEVLETTL